MINEKTLLAICNQFNLGTPVANVSPVTGGLLHLMWKLSTTNGTYAIKQLSKDIKLTPKVKKAYELTEQIAQEFKKRGIPAISALEAKGHHLIIIANTAYLVYPWLNAKALDKDAVSENHAIKIAEILAKMHLIHLHIDEMVDTEFDVHPNEQIINLINQSISCECAFADHLKENQKRVIDINNAYHLAISVLKEHSVIGHGDLDQKNVLWDENNNPLLIDWESARKLNPTYEIINAALDWSGITSETFNEHLFIKMIQSYKSAGGKIDQKHVHAAFYGVLGNWLNWMVYNIERACNTDPDEVNQRTLGEEQVQQVLVTLVRVQSQLPLLIQTSQ